MVSVQSEFKGFLSCFFKKCQRPISMKIAEKFISEANNAADSLVVLTMNGTL